MLGNDDGQDNGRTLTFASNDRRGRAADDGEWQLTRAGGGPGDKEDGRRLEKGKERPLTHRKVFFN